MEEQKTEEVIKNYCYDCEKEIEMEGEELKNGVLLKFKIPSEGRGKDDEEIYIYKCKECYEKNPALTNFRKCEVYSRIVGYIRPVQQWNKGKSEEYIARKNYKISEQLGDQIEERLS
jgi:hypothetical protein